ncbi:hypothetical protein [Methylovirgula sp. 4M-Z18]|uniref:hypothetical protein n=1 Tax=Methylovirgula sp. 4M-Z18 TaxID=2293567 RepID=UPI000E2F81D9|nr:hypothetical protein [Methylovirgula sp. 4M-Z18]
MAEAALQLVPKDELRVKMDTILHAFKGDYDEALRAVLAELIAVQGRTEAAVSFGYVRGDLINHASDRKADAASSASLKS